MFHVWFFGNRLSFCRLGWPGTFYVYLDDLILCQSWMALMYQFEPSCMDRTVFTEKYFVSQPRHLISTNLIWINQFACWIISVAWAENRAIYKAVCEKWALWLENTAKDSLRKFLTILGSYVIVPGLSILITSMWPNSSDTRMSC